MANQEHILVYVVRHGETTLNAEDKFRGPLNPPLDRKGIQQAHSVANFLSNIPVCAIVSSDKKRSMQTAEIIAKAKGCTVHTNKNLRAWDVGDLGGQPRNAENKAIVKAHVDNPDEPMPGGEALNSFRARIRPVLQAALDKALETGVPVIIVAHSSIVHETGEVCNGKSSSVLVKPGGVAAIYIKNGKIGAEAIFRPDTERIGSRQDTVS